MYPPPISVMSGVPQGSVLGPLLFLIYMNDLPDNVVSPAGIKIFADDTKLYRAYVDNETSPLTQSLQTFCSWSQTWQLSVAYNKCCHFIRVSKRSTFHTLLTFWYSLAIRIVYKRSRCVFDLGS